VIDRRRFLAVVGGTLLPSPRRAGAQPAKLVYRVGVIADKAGYEALKAGLRDVGYAEGRDMVLEFRAIDSGDVRFLDVATELARIPVDVIVAGTTPAILAAKQATTAIPIVGLSVDPVASRLVASLAKPGGNITGLSLDEVGTNATRLELLKEAAPAVTRVAVLTTSTNPSSSQMLKETERAAQTLGVEVHAFELRGGDDLAKTFAAMTTRRVDSLIVLPSAVASSRRTQIVILALRHRLPSMFWRREFVDLGGLLSYGPDRSEIYRRAAVLVGKILQGAKPGDLPVGQPRKFDLIVNLRTAKALGLTIPSSVLLLAAEVIE